MIYRSYRNGNCVFFCIPTVRKKLGVAFVGAGVGGGEGLAVPFVGAAVGAAVGPGLQGALRPGPYHSYYFDWNSDKI